MDIDIVPEPGGLIIQSTAGAIPITNKKGERTMQKVKVKRYVPGKRPDYAPESSSSEDDDEMLVTRARRAMGKEEEDARLRRLRERHQEAEQEEDDRHARHRQIHEPEVLEDGEVSEGHEGEDAAPDIKRETDATKDRGSRKVFRIEAEESSSEEEDLAEEEIDRRRAALRARAQARRGQEGEAMAQQEEEKGGMGGEDKEESEEESSEYEEYSDSEEEETGPRLKPVFVSKRDRVTIQEKEQEAQKVKHQEEMAKRRAEARKRETVRMVETEARKAHDGDEIVITDDTIAAVNTDDENGEEEYEAWKVRELRRIKRDREEREQEEKEKQELERIRSMTDEQRRDEERRNPKQVTNSAKKGRYKFLQKYYHRGVFFMDKEEDIFKRDVSNPTLEDHFDKKVLPKVMQVKNFGRSGRTKYTHLADQDTTQADSPWQGENSLSRKFQAKLAGGDKQSFVKPTSKKY